MNSVNSKGTTNTSPEEKHITNGTYFCSFFSLASVNNGLWCCLYRTRGDVKALMDTNGKESVNFYLVSASLVDVYRHQKEEDQTNETQTTKPNSALSKHNTARFPCVCTQITSATHNSLIKNKKERKRAQFKKRRFSAQFDNGSEHERFFCRQLVTKYEQLRRMNRLKGCCQSTHPSRVPATRAWSAGASDQPAQQT